MLAVHMLSTACYTHGYAYYSNVAVSTCYAGILFSKVNLNDCDEVLPAAIADLRDLLSREGALQALVHKSPGRQSKEHVLLQLVVLSIFSLYDITCTHQGQKLGWAHFTS